MLVGIEETEEQTEDIKRKTRCRLWKDNAETIKDQGATETARAIYENAVFLYPKKLSLWMNLVSLEQKLGSND